MATAITHRHATFQITEKERKEEGKGFHFKGRITWLFVFHITRWALEAAQILLPKNFQKADRSSN